MKIEVANVLIEQKVNENSSISVNQLRKHVFSTGNHRFLARLLWPLVGIDERSDWKVERAMQNDSQVLVLSRSVGAASETLWKWGGREDIVRTCSRRPYLGKVGNAKRR